jgi:hypothetical protein
VRIYISSSIARRGSRVSFLVIEYVFNINPNYFMLIDDPNFEDIVRIRINDLAYVRVAEKLHILLQVFL